MRSIDLDRSRSSPAWTNGTPWASTVKSMPQVLRPHPVGGRRRPAGGGTGRCPTASGCRGPRRRRCAPAGRRCSRRARRCSATSEPFTVARCGRRTCSRRGCRPGRRGSGRPTAAARSSWACGRRADDHLVGVVPEAVDHALVEHEVVAAVERPAAAHGVAQAVVERADAGAGHVSCVACSKRASFGHLAEVPALAVEVDRRAVDAVLGQRQLVERGAQVRACWPWSGGPSGRSGSRRPCSRAPTSRRSRSAASPSWRARWPCSGSTSTSRWRRRR